MDLTAAIQTPLGQYHLELCLKLQAPQTIALLGPNGAGKSKFLETLAGIFPLENGLIRLGTKIFDDTHRGIRCSPQERKIGLMFQDHRLFPHLNALENIAYPLQNRGMKKPEAYDLAWQWIERLELEACSKRKASFFSGGEAQKVSFARTLITKPKLLLLDEPFASLDIKSFEQVSKLLQAYLESFGGICLLVTHKQERAQELADAFLVIEAGKIVRQGTMKKLSFICTTNLGKK